MGLDATARRRVIGALFLIAALGMLVVGQTLLKNHLRDLGFLVYWLLCFVFTGLAILVAFLDARALQYRTRREARELIEKTLGQIEKDARKSPPRPPSNDGN
ncbi:MAG TPA: hypothetical protein VFE51_13310 [Verrucomicrobiae bacterium]|nr:hypothetical protein [Verrucomicrobiae bacterium]